MIRVRFWGTRGSITTPGKSTWNYGGNTACVQLIAYENGVPGAAEQPNNPQLILDGGSGLASLQTRLLKGPWGQGKGQLHILLSHYHWDHIIGLPFFTPLFIKGNRVAFYGASVDDLKASVEHLFTSNYSPVKSVQNVAARLTYHPLHPDGTNVAGFTIQAVETRHPGKTMAFRIQYGSTTIVYSPDHEAGDDAVDSALVNLARHADMWILNGHYSQSEVATHAGWGHSSHLQAVNLALEANVKRLLLFHHSPEHDDATLDTMHREASAAARNRIEVLMGRDNMALDVESVPN